MESVKKILCESCQHYMKNSSCGACVDMGMKKTEQLINDFKNSDDDVANAGQTEETIDINFGLTEIDRYKYACKVVANDPADFEVVNPYNCKYYFSNAIKFF